MPATDSSVGRMISSIPTASQPSLAPFLPTGFWAGTFDRPDSRVWARIHLVLGLSGGTSDSGKTPHQILEFPNEPYRVVKPIPVLFEVGEPAGIIASFRDANVSMVGETWCEAYNGLKAEILNTFEDCLVNERVLGPEPKRQLSVLRDHIQNR